MAVEQTNYALALVYLEEGLLAQEAKVTIRRSSGSNPVMTTALGWAGDSPGAPMMEIDVSNAVPSDDFEFDPGPFIQGVKRCRIRIELPGRKLSTICQIYEDNFDHAVNGAATLEFRCRAQMAQWELV
jgi:hypothetical protein